MEKITVVDEKDEVIGEARVNKILPFEIYRVSSLIVENHKGQVLLAKRSYSMVKSPGLWGPSCEGTVRKGETYHETMIREAKEELGISGIEYLELKKQRVRKPYNHFKMWYKVKLDWPIKKFKIQSEEVQKLKWIKKEKLIEMAKRNSKVLTPSFKEFIKRFYQNNGRNI